MTARAMASRASGRRSENNFNRPTDMAWDAAGNIFVADGYGNSRIAKFDKNGNYIKSWGSRGTEPGQFNTAHSIATDTPGNVYVADRENKRIQVFDNNGTFKTQCNVGRPGAICISPGSHQYLFSSKKYRSSNGHASKLWGTLMRHSLLLTRTISHWSQTTRPTPRSSAKCSGCSPRAALRSSTRS